MSNKNKKRFVPKILHSERGSAAMEFALLLPILATLIFGAIDFGVMLWNKEILVNAAREGARQGALFTGGAATADVASVVEQMLHDGGVSTTGLTVSVEGQGGAFGTPLTVNAAIPWDFFVIDHLVPGMNVDQLQAAVTMMNEGN